VSRRLTSVLVAVAAAFTLLALAGEAYACTCIRGSIDERLDDADAAAIGRFVSQETRMLRGARQALLTFEVDQRVKGDVAKTIVVRSVPGCAPEVEPDRAVGMLLQRAPDGGWLGSLCSRVTPGELVAAGGEPRGTVIKVAIGLVILGLVLAWAFRRRARGARPNLPGAPSS
jgi:MYXO-CTERM domain-containing protein